MREFIATWTDPHKRTAVSGTLLTKKLAEDWVARNPDVKAGRMTIYRLVPVSTTEEEITTTTTRKVIV